MYVYVYIHTYIYIYIHTYIHIYVCLCTHLHQRYAYAPTYAKRFTIHGVHQGVIEKRPVERSAEEMVEAAVFQQVGSVTVGSVTVGSVTVCSALALIQVLLFSREKRTYIHPRYIHGHTHMHETVLLCPKKRARTHAIHAK